MLPTLSSCHSLRLPPTEKDDRYNLHVRTGSASTLYNSLVFAYGGLTIGLDLSIVSAHEILTAFAANCANKKTKNLDDYLSGELFVLNLIEKTWVRVDVDSKPCARMFHEILAMNNKLYVYGGLAVDPNDGNKLVALQDLWVLDLSTKKWQCLAELSGTGGRYCHKMTSISSIPGNPDHVGLLVAGGRTIDNKSNLTNVIYDLVEEIWLPPRHLLDENNQPIHIDYVRSLLVSLNLNHKLSILSYTHDEPMLHAFRVGSSIGSGTPISINTNVSSVVPHNLKYPVAGLFGQNIILTGFLQNDYDISIFVFNSPTGKWSRLNVFCNHDYGSHRFWGGFAWQSHHRVVLIGNYVTSRTTSSIRYFTCLIAVNLPVTNILASREMAGANQSDNKLESDSDTDANKSINNESRRPSNSSTKAISFTDYVHYAAPTTNVTTIRSVFPPAAVTLGRNFLDRFGDLVLDFELISVNGDRIPVSMMVLLERWGTYFVELLARGYISTVEQFDLSQKTKPVIEMEEYTDVRDVPQFRLPFQDKENNKPFEESTVDPKSDTNSTNDVELLNSSLQDLPPQLPLPNEQIPPVPNPVSFKSSSRKNSSDLASPRGSLIHTLTQLRNIPVKSPKASPRASPRASIAESSGLNQGQALGIDISGSPIPSLKPEDSKPEPEPKKPSQSTFERLLNFDTLEDGSFQMESCLIPRKLYIPFSTISVKSFCEYFYTGQIGNKWLLSPTTLDNLILAKHCHVPLLYDLICEVLYGIIGRREAWIITKARELKNEYVNKMELYGEEIDLECPLDEYEGLIETVDDGYLDLAFLSRTANMFHSTSTTNKGKRESVGKKDKEKKQANSNEEGKTQEGKTQEDKIQEDKIQEYKTQEDKIQEDESTSDDNESQTSNDSKSSTSSDPSAPSVKSSTSGYAFFESHDLPSMGPDSKSIFDKKNAGPWEKPNEFTLEQLVSVELPIPTMEIIEQIAQAVTMTADLKLILRVNNIKHMSKLLDQYEQQTKKELASLEFKLPKPRKPTMPDLPKSSPEDISVTTPQATTPNKTMTEPFSSVPFPVPEAHPSILRSTTSYTSLSGVSTPPGSTLERERTNSSLRAGLASLTPFKPVKDEKDDDNSSILSNKKKHGIFHMLGHSKSKDQLVEKKRLFGKKK